MKLIKNIILLLLLSTFLLSCKGDDPEPTPPAVVVFTIKADANGTVAEIENNQIFNMVNHDELGMNVTNNMDDAIKLKIEVISLVGNGNGVELCFSQCRTSVAIGDFDIKSIASKETTTNVQTHLKPSDSFDGARSLSVELKVNQVDENDNDIVGGKEVSFIYQYTAP